MTCRLVAEAMLALMECTGKMHVEASVRALAEQLGFGLATISHALRSLSGECLRGRKRPAVPILFKRRSRRRPVLRDDGTFLCPPNNYELLPPFTAGKMPNAEHTDAQVSQRTVMFRIGQKITDCFRGKKGLAKSRYLALRVIEREPVRTARELAEKATLLPKTASNALTELHRHGLIEKRAGQWQRTRKCLATVARERGSAGHAERQRREHIADRGRYQERLHDPLRTRKLDVVSKPEPAVPDGAPEPAWATDEVPPEAFKHAADWRPYRQRE